MAREVSKHRAIGSSHLAFIVILDALLAHNTLIAGRWTSPALRVAKEKQPAALHLIPDEEA